MKRYWVSLVVVGLAVALLASPALVQERGEGQTRRGQRARGTSRGGMMMMRRPGGAYLPDYTRSIRDLSDQQRAQIREIRQAAQEKIREIQKRMNDDIRKLLTPEQAKAMDEAERRVTHRGPGGVILTDAQKKVLDDARAQAAKAEDREARSAILREAYQKVQATYTDEQKKQAEEMRQRFSTRRGRPGGAEGGRERTRRERPQGEP